MAYKDKAQKTAYQNKYIGANYDRINLTVPKGRKEYIFFAAKQSGESVNAFINRLINAELDRLGIEVGGSFHPEVGPGDSLL